MKETESPNTCPTCCRPILILDAGSAKRERFCVRATNTCRAAEMTRLQSDRSLAVLMASAAEDYLTANTHMNWHRLNELVTEWKARK